MWKPHRALPTCMGALRGLQPWQSWALVLGRGAPRVAGRRPLAAPLPWDLGAGEEQEEARGGLAEEPSKGPRGRAEESPGNPGEETGSWPFAA